MFCVEGLQECGGVQELEWEIKPRVTRLTRRKLISARGAQYDGVAVTPFVVSPEQLCRSERFTASTAGGLTDNS